MRKNLRMILLSTIVATCGMMFTSCKDYDDDIDSVNDRIDKLEKDKIGSVDEQIAAIKSSISSLENAYKAADAELKSALEKQATDLAAAKSELEAAIQSQKNSLDGDIEKLTGDLTALSNKIEGYNTSLSAEIKKVADDLEANHYTKTDIDAKLAELDADFAGEIAGLNTKIGQCEGAISAIDAQIKTMQGLIDGKVDKSDYDSFTQKTNSSIQENAKAISVLEGLCAGFDEGTTIKNYIDEAKQSVVAMLDSYVLKETYESFVEEYGTFKTDVESKVSGNTAKITALESWKEELTKDGGTLDQLEERLQTAIKEKTTLADVKATYNKSCTEFLAGVNAIITDALAEDGIIGKELQTKLDALKTELQTKIDALETRIEAVEGKLEAIVGQIQSLVYVPEFADGTTEMPCYTFGDATVNAPVVLKFRVSPAAMVSKMAGLNDAHALSLITEEVKTRAGEAPAATIKGVEVLDAATGTFTVSAKIENYPADARKAVAIALAVKADIDETGVSNDVVSNFAGVVKAADATELIFALYDGENKYDANATIEIPWNTTKEDSKREILKDLVLKVSLDGGTEYITLEDASAIIGETLVASTYTTTSTPEKTDSEFEITNVTDAECGVETYPSVQFATANGTSALVGKTVVFDYTIKAKLGENDAANALTGKVTYKPVKDNVTLTFEKVTLPWTYEFVKTGLGAKDGSDTWRPAVSDKFNEVVLTGLPEGADLSEVLSGTLTKKITVDGEDVLTTADFTVAAGDEGKIKITVDAEKYEWGKTYDIEYTYTKDESEYVLSGSIEFGAAPSNVSYEYPAVTVNYEDKTIDDLTWAKVYEAWTGADSTYFKDAGEFTEAIFAGTVQPSPVKGTKLINADNEVPGKDVAETNGTKITAEESMLKGELKKADITAEGDKFVQNATWTTWYGQKITVTLTYNVDLPEYTLKPSEAYVKDGVIGTTGEVDPTDEKWTVKLEGAVKDYYSFTPASDDVKKTFAKKSVDGSGKVFAVVTEGENPVVTWTNGITTEKDLEMTVKLVLGENTVVASEDFTIKADDPIKTFEQRKDLEIKYENNKTLEIDLLTGISLVDIKGDAWILDNGTPKKTDTKQYTAKAVFGMKTGSDATVGIEFGAPTNEDGLTFTMDQNKLKYTTDNSVLQKDVTVTIPAKITYWLGEKETTITVVLKAAE